MPEDAAADTAPEPLFDARGLHVVYDARRRSREILHGVDLQVDAGEIVAIVGESGSGKSTLVNAALGLLPRSGRVSAGSVRIGGIETAGGRRGAVRAVRGAIVGYVPQDPLVSLNPTMRIGAQVAEALRLPVRSAPAARAGVLEALARAGLLDAERLLAQFPHQLSGGMRQRVLIAIALAGRPRLIVADEPTSALDVTVQAHVLDHVTGLVRQDGLGLLLVTHNLLLAADRADRIVVMRDGAVVESGTTEAILSAPRAEYTRTLLSRVPGVTALAVARAPRGDGPSTSAPEPLVRLSGATRRFRHPRGGTGGGIDDVSLDVHAGRTLGLVGESGSGKTTTLRIALGLERADTGRVELFGTDITTARERAVRPLRRRIQLVQQDPWGSLDPRLTVQRLIEEPLGAFGVGDRAERRTRVAETLDAVALSRSFADRLPRELSGGQRQRVALARAIVLRPDVLLLDEPVSALDVSVQFQILELLGVLQRELGLGYLLVSHDLAVVRQLCDEIIVLSDGRIVEAGPAHQVLDAPRAEQTRHLLDAVPGAGSLPVLRRAAWFQELSAPAHGEEEGIRA